MASTARAEEQAARLVLLSRIASRLLEAEDPRAVTAEICDDVLTLLRCEVYFNFLVEPDADRLHLNAFRGIPDEQARLVEWLGFGEAVCGTVAKERRRIIVEDIPHCDGCRADFVRAFGVTAYCCQPLIASERLLGTLSFGARDRTKFTPDDLRLMRTVADQLATALDRAASNRALREANEQLREADRRKDEFLGVLSHELRNPLAPIRASVFLLNRSSALDERARRAAGVIDRQAAQLSRLIDDLLDVTRIARGKIRLQRAPLDLADLVEHVVEDHRASMGANQPRLELQVRERPLWVEADAARVAQVVGNLLHNAAKFTPADGKVVVSLGDSVADAAAAASAAGPRFAEIEVRDTGVGMDAATLAHLFKPFSQADRSLDRSRGGLGLGLALAKGLVDLHGGAIAAASEGPGTGAVFTVRFPLAEPPPLLAEPLASFGQRLARGAGGAPRKVLVIEDQRDSADMLREILEFAGHHQVAVAHDGREGVQKAIELRPDVVLCDIGLPELDGYGVARALRASPALRGAAPFLVALTGYALPEDVRRAREAGFDRHLSKPASVEALERVFRDYEEARLEAAGEAAPA